MKCCLESFLTIIYPFVGIIAVLAVMLSSIFINNLFNTDIPEDNDVNISKTDIRKW